MKMYIGKYTDNVTGTAKERDLIAGYYKHVMEYNDFYEPLRDIKSHIIELEYKVKEAKQNLQAIKNARKHPQDFPYSYTTDSTLNTSMKNLERIENKLAWEKNQYNVYLGKQQKADAVMKESMKKLNTFRKEHGIDFHVIRDSGY